MTLLGRLIKVQFSKEKRDISVKSKLLTIPSNNTKINVQLDSNKMIVMNEYIDLNNTLKEMTDPEENIPVNDQETGSYYEDEIVQLGGPNNGQFPNIIKLFIVIILTVI